MHNGIDAFDFDTPRRLRYIVAINPSTEDIHSVDYDPWAFRRGEMGEIIEWMMFGYYVDITIDGTHNYLIRVVAWGSYPDQGDQMVRFGADVAERLLRAPMRLPINELRVFIAQTEEGVMDIDVNVPDGNNNTIWGGGSGNTMNVSPVAPEIGGVGGHYLDLLAEAAALVYGATPPPPPPNTTTGGVRQRLARIGDVDEEFTGYRIGTNSTYRRALWRVKHELAQATTIREGRTPIGRRPLKRLTPSTLAEAYSSRERPLVFRRPAECERYVPRILPATLAAWKFVVLLGLFYWVSWLVCLKVDAWRSPDIERDGNYYYKWILFPLAAVFLIIYMTPYRVVFTIFGTHRVRKTFFSW